MTTRPSALLNLPLVLEANYVDWLGRHLRHIDSCTFPCRRPCGWITGSNRPPAPWQN